MSQYVTITGDDLVYFKRIVQQAISGDFGDLSEVRVVFNEGQICIGTNGYSSEWIGQAGNDGMTRGATDEPEQIGDILRRLGIVEQVARNAQDRLGVNLGMVDDQPIGRIRQ